MRELGLGIDRVCGLLSPNKIAKRLGRSVSQNSARRMDPLLKNLLRLLLVLCEVSLVLNMASCGDSAYSGFELIRRTVVFEIKREYEWGAVALTFISAMSLAGHGGSGGRKSAVSHALRHNRPGHVVGGGRGGIL